MLQTILLGAALSTDALTAGAAYGADGIRIDLKKMFLISIIGSACLGAALCFGTLIRSLVPDFLIRGVCFASLFLLALLRLSDSLIKNYINRHCLLRRDIHFSFSRLRFILSIYADPANADRDSSRTLSMKEAAFFGAALSIDSLAAGAFAAFLPVSIPLTVLGSLLLNMTALAFGQWAGRRLSRCVRTDLTWLSALLFLYLALSRL